MRSIVVVLNDGETWSGITGCSIVDVPEQIDDSEIDEFVKDAVKNKTPSVLATFFT